MYLILMLFGIASRKVRRAEDIPILYRAMKSNIGIGDDTKILKLKIIENESKDAILREKQFMFPVLMYNLQKMYQI